MQITKQSAIRFMQITMQSTLRFMQITKQSALRFMQNLLRTFVRNTKFKSCKANRFVLHYTNRFAQTKVNYNERMSGSRQYFGSLSTYQVYWVWRSSQVIPANNRI